MSVTDINLTRQDDGKTYILVGIEPGNLLVTLYKLPIKGECVFYGNTNTRKIKINLENGKPFYIIINYSKLDRFYIDNDYIWIPFNANSINRLVKEDKELFTELLKNSVVDNLME